MKKKRLSLLLFMVLNFFVFSQKVFAEEPGYVMYWEWFDEEFNIVEKDCEYVIGEMKNFSGKNIVNYEIAFTILDEQKFPIGKASYITKKINWKNNSIEPFVLEFNRIEEDGNVEIGYIDFIYLASITYDDGTVYNDPGNKYFLKTILPEYKKELQNLKDNNFAVFDEQISD